VDEFIFKFTHDRVIDWLYDIDSTDLSIYLW
jgi:hypothetical protein